MSALEPLEIVQLEDDLYQLQLDFVHAFLIHDPIDGWILIDTGYPVKRGHPNIVIRALQKMNLTTSAIKQILVTHGHPDHVGNIGEVEAQSHAPIWMSQQDAAILEAFIPVRPIYTPAGDPGKQIPFFSPAPVTHRLVDGEQIPLAGGITAIATPGHSAGQLSFLWHRHHNILFAADTITNVDHHVMIAPSNENYTTARASLKKLANYSFDQLLVSHGADLLSNADQIFQQKWLPELIAQTLNSKQK
ncbi:MBL fold metallo-hydrolase [Loigolactobacillus jiayinensis]|uniref:MBL fold metallo-hydrolase n=1 Tax=Loigolactobacillus jiayinensis TaxID=2486016 RepID=A0ABW1RG96_9LACO|nr:MBL fold metallo-hydrolase [Loigolactobacillus jiayinensis]